MSTSIQSLDHHGEHEFTVPVEQPVRNTFDHRLTDPSSESDIDAFELFATPIPLTGERKTTSRRELWSWYLYYVRLQISGAATRVSS